jgi:hypothetical protein
MKYIIIIISFLFLSCASRKVSVNKIEIKKDSITKIDTKIESKEVSNIEIKNDILIDEITIKPIDSSKEITINGIKYKNVVLSIKKTKDNSLYLKDKTIHYNEAKQQINTVSTIKKESKKEIDKKANYFIYLWLLLIPATYYGFKFFKTFLV